MTNFQEKLENYDKTATECVRKAAGLINGVRARMDPKTREDFIAEFLYNFRLEIIVSEKSRNENNKKAFARGLREAVEYEIDRFCNLTLRS